MKKLHCLAVMVSVFCLIAPVYAGVLYAETRLGYNNVEAQESISEDAYWGSEYSIYSGLSSPSGYTTASAAAQAQEGILKAAVSAASGSSYYGESGASAQASWTMPFRFVNDALTGTVGRVTLPIQFEGTFDALVFPYPAPWWIARASTYFSSSISATTESGSQYFAYYSSLLSIYNGYAESSQLQSRYDATHRGLEAVTPGRLGIDVDFIWGETINLTAELSVGCGVIESDEEPNSFASCYVDAFRSSYWAGLSGLQSNGILVTDYTIETDSDLDFTRSLVPAISTPIPEPATLAVFSLGLLLLGTVIRSNNPHQRSSQQLET